MSTSEDVARLREELRSSTRDAAVGVAERVRDVLPRVVAEHGAQTESHLDALGLLADALSRADDDFGAAEVYDVMADMAPQVPLGEESGAEMAHTLRGLAAMSRAYDDKGVSLPALDAVVARAETELGTLHPRVLALLELRARTATALNAGTGVEAYGVLVARTAQLGEDSDAYVTALAAQASAFNRVDRDDEAAQVWSRVVEGRRALYGLTDDRTLEASWSQVRSLVWSEQGTEAAQRLDDLLPLLDLQEPRLREALRWRARLYHRNEETAAAVATWSRVIALSARVGEALSTDALDDRFFHADEVAIEDPARAYELLVALTEDAAETLGASSHAALRAGVQADVLRHQLTITRGTPLRRSGTAHSPEDLERARGFVADAAAAYRRALGADSVSPDDPLDLQAVLFAAIGHETGLHSAETRSDALARTSAVLDSATGELSTPSLSVLERWSTALLSAERLTEACEVLETLVARAAKVGTPARHVDALTSLALAQRRSGDVHGAIDLLESAIAEADRAELGSSRTIELRTQRALALSELGRGAEAVAELQSCLALSDSLRLRNDLSVVYIKNGRHREARALLEQTLASITDPTINASTTGMRLRGNLALATCELGDHAEAAAQYDRLLAEQRATLTPDDRDVLRTRHNRALEEFHMNNNDRAVTLLTAVLADSSRALGAEAPATLSTLWALASATDDAGDLPGAITLMRQVWEQRSHVLGLTHPGTLSARASLGRMLRRAGLTDEADSIDLTQLGDGGSTDAALRIALRLFEEGRFAQSLVRYTAARDGILDPDSLDKLTAERGIADCLYRLDSYAEAHDAYVRLVPQMRRLAPDDHWAIAEAHRNASLALMHLGRHAESVVAARASLDEATRATPDEERLLTFQLTLGRKLAAAGEHEEALTLHKDTAARREALFGAKHPLTLDARDDVAEELILTGRLKEGVRAYRRLIPELEKEFGADSPQARRAKRNQQKGIASDKRWKEIISFGVIAVVIIGVVIWNTF